MQSGEEDPGAADEQALRPSVAPGIPIISLGVIGLSVAMFFVLDHQLPMTEVPDFGAVSFGALHGPLVRAGEYWRLLTTAVEHGNLVHLGLNMWVVWTLGATFERVIGSVRFLQISLVTCLGASFFVLLFSYDAVTVGASGMICGWAGAMLPISTREGRRHLGLWLGQIALISVVPMFLRQGGVQGVPLVSWQGHLGGFLFGVPAGFALRAGPVWFRRAMPALVALTAAACVAATRLGEPLP